MPRKKLTFEDSLAKLEKIVLELESGDNTLEELMQNYQEGVKLGQNCLAELQKAEKMMDLQVKEKNDKVVEEPLEIEGE